MTNMLPIANFAMPILASFAYFLLLGFQFQMRKFKKRLLGMVFLGVIVGFLFATALVTLLIYGARYNQLPDLTRVLVFAPFAEEISKFLGILLGVLYIRRYHPSRFETVRLAGGVGLGFGLFEAYDYIVGGANLSATISRLMVSVPFHIGSAMLLGFRVAKRENATQVIVLFLAIALHVISNLLALFSALLQGLVFWILLLALYFFGERLYLKKT